MPRIYRWAVPVGVVMIFMMIATARGGLYTRGRRLMKKAEKATGSEKAELVNRAIDYWHKGLGSTINTHQRIWCVNGLEDAAPKNTRAADILFDYFVKNLDAADPWEQTDAIEWLGKSGRPGAVDPLKTIRAKAKTSSSDDRRLRYLVDMAFVNLEKTGVTVNRP